MKSRAPAAHCLHGQIYAAPGSHYDHRHHRIDRLNFLEQLHSLLSGGGVARIVQIDDDKVEIFMLEARRTLRRRFHRFDFVAFALQ